MKLSFILIILIILGIGISNGQTNTFPATGSVGIGTLSPSSYFHGGNNRVLEIYNPNNTLNSQSHVILSTGSTLNNSGAGTLSWISRNSTGFQGMAYIGSMIQGDATLNSSASLIFATSNGSAVYPRMVIDKDGNVGIGTINPNEMLSVKGKIRAQEIKVETANWPDYVFAKHYQLPSLQETEKHINEKGHLPGIPSAEEVKANGVDLGEMNAKLLQKIEELTLYLIEQNKKVDKLEKIIIKTNSNNMKHLYLSIILLLLTLQSFSQISTDQSGIKTTVINSLTANGAQPMRYEIAALGYNSYHWQNGGLIIVELFHRLYSTGYEKYIIDNGYGRGANSGAALVKLVESHGIMHNAKISLGTPKNLTTTLGGEINRELPVYLDVREYSEYKVRITYMQDKVDVITTYNQIKITATPAGVAVPDFYAPIVLDNDLSSSGKLMVSGVGNHYIENGNLGIGTKSPAERLSVNGKIRANEIKVETSGWPDYVFSKDYQLPSLQETENHIKEKGHLPGIPSAEEVKANGVDLGDMNARLLKKIEELTLHLIASEKRNLLQNQKQLALIKQQQKDIKYLKTKIK